MNRRTSLLFCIVLTFPILTSCSRHTSANSSENTTPAITTSSIKTKAKKKPARKVTRPNPVQASKKANDASVSDLKIARESVVMYNNMYDIFGIIFDNLNNCDLAVQKVRQYADEHRDEMLEAQSEMEQEHQSLSDTDKKRFTDWRQRRDMQMINDSMQLMIELNYRCKQQAKKIDALIASLSSK